jgi:hypothetical protein
LSAFFARVASTSRWNLSPARTQGPSANMPPSSESLRAVVRHYRLRRQERDDEAAWWGANSLPFAVALRRASLARTENGDKHGHQWRLDDEVLNEASRMLGSIIDELQACQSFDQLFDYVTKALCNLSGVAEMYIYDTTDRIAYARGPTLAPNRVNLHRGTRDGAMARWRLSQALALGKRQYAWIGSRGSFRI